MADTFEFNVNNLDCAHCGAKIEALISDMQSIETAVLNFPLKKLTVTGEVDEETVMLMNELAKAIEPDVELVQIAEKSENHTHSHGEEDGSLKSEIILLIVVVLVFVSAIIMGKLNLPSAVSLVFYILSYLILGKDVLVSAFRSIKSGNFFDENTLMTVATIGAFALGEYSEAVGVMLFFKIGELFEDYAVAKSRKAITDVSELKVPEADVLISGEFKRVSSDKIKKGDILRIKVGERAAADGIVETGESKIDTSAVNGEPVPVVIRKGDAVMSGCINLANTFTMKATAAADESMLSKIAKAVETASAEKPKIDKFITRFSRIYTPVVLAAAFLTALIGSLITHDFHKWIYSALTFLVISCPCALVLSVPLAYFSGIGAASKLGILFKGGNAIEALAKVKAFVFDKTGTLTNGTFSVTEIKSFGNMSENEILEICAGCEQSSSHPVAESIVSYCRGKNIKLKSAESLTEIAGHGISAAMDGKNILCGNERLINENNLTVPETENFAGTPVYIAADGKIEGLIIVSDTVKNSSAGTIKQLKDMGLYTSMLTGDKQSNAEIVGKQLGIDYARGGLLPDEKLTEINNIRKNHGAVMFTGDGINDAPVLAGADVGGAMHTGADLALEAADAVFMNSEPESVVKAKKIADKTLRISYENIIFALAVKAIVLILGMFGHPNMWLAVFADSGTAMLLILNSIRVLNIRKYR
ncbi:MAG: cadmium-translocating P-type ATPase [Ruminococcus sp.]|nr:cadmium-translocating P-type ATPase [Ruminococcus sp.]